MAVRRRRRRETEVVERATACDRELAGATSAFPRGDADQTCAPGRREEQQQQQVLSGSQHLPLWRREQSAAGLGERRPARQSGKATPSWTSSTTPQSRERELTCRLPSVSLGRGRCGLRLCAARPAPSRAGPGSAAVFDSTGPLSRARGLVNSLIRQ